MVVLGWVERPTDKLWPPFREADWRDSCRRGRFLRASHVRRSAGGRSPATGVTEGAISFIRGFDPRTRGALFFFVHVFVRKNAEQHPFSRTLSSISCQDGLTTTFSNGLSSPKAAGRSRTRRRWTALMGHASVPTGNLKVLNALAPVLALAALRASQPGVPVGASSRSGRPASRSGPTLPQKYCYIFHVMTSCEFTPRWPSRSERSRPGCPFFRHGGAGVGRTAEG